MKYSVKDLTTEEKLRVLMGDGGWNTNTANGKLYQIQVSDGPVGLRKPAQDEKGEWYNLPAVAHPSTQLLANTWRPELARKTGEMIADDCIDGNVDILLAPGVNIKRNPLCGRNFEYFSEDPLVSGVFGREYIAGVQSREVGTTLKHFCCNNAEYSRYFLSSEVDERTLREIYLEPFRIAAEAKPWATMCAYNLVNGVRMSEHKKLYTVLREEFGFDGLMMSDWGAVQDHAASIRAGLDLEMPECELSHKTLTAAYERGEVSDEELDACVERMLHFIERSENASKTRKAKTTVADRLAAAREVAEKGMVLLKNDYVLPLAKDARVSVTGPYANQYISGAGSSIVTPIETPLTLAETLKAALPEGEVIYQPIRGDGSSYPRGNILFRAVNVAYDTDAAIVCVGQVDRENIDRDHMRLDVFQEKFIQETAKQNENTIVILFAGAPIDMSAWIDDVAAVIWAGYPGEEGAKALADILVGKVNPSGRLTETFPMTDADAPTYGQYYDPMKCLYSEALLVGYRWFDTAPLLGKDPAVRFPFGYGLTYSDIQYTDMTIAPAGDGFDVTVELENVSEVDGTELVQVYVHEVHPVVFRPAKELKGFRMVEVKAGATATVTIHLSRRDFAYYSTGVDAWRVTPGQFEIIVARDAETPEFVETVDVK